MNKKRFTSFAVLCGLIAMFAQVSYAGGINDMTSPLQGRWYLRTVTHQFGVTWAGTPSQCKNLTWKHAGTDVQAWAPEAVYAAEAGLVKEASTHASEGGWIVILHTHPGESPFTTVYWHVTPIVSPGQSVTEGQGIGNISNLGARTHFHFGVRVGSYSNPVSRVGALPQTTACPPYPPFPGNFINPLSLPYHPK